MSYGFYTIFVRADASHSCSDALMCPSSIRRAPGRASAMVSFSNVSSTFGLPIARLFDISTCCLWIPFIVDVFVANANTVVSLHLRLRINVLGTPPLVCHCLATFASPVKHCSALFSLHFVHDVYRDIYRLSFLVDVRHLGTEPE